MNKLNQHYPSRFLVQLVRVTGLAGVLCLTPARAIPLSISQTYQQNWVKIGQNNETVMSDALSKTDGMREPRAHLFHTAIGGVITKKVLLSWHTNADTIQFPMYASWMGSTNAGRTWDAPTATTAAPDSLEFAGLVKRVTDGVLVSIPYYPNPDGTNGTSFTFSYHTSTNNGGSWTKHTNAGLIDFGTQLMDGGHAFRFARGIVQENDGTLHATGYVTFVSGENHRVALMRSTNGGATWNYRTIIQYSPKPAGDFNEATMVRCRDGSMLVVMRQGANPLQYRRSTDATLMTWGALAALPGLSTNLGADPYLWLMPNGMLALSYGQHIESGVYDKRDCRLAISPDGSGLNWSTNLTTFTASTTTWQGNSTGYTSVIPVSSHRLMQFSDRAEKTWYYTNSQKTPNPFSIWTKIIDVVPNHKNRIDLQGLYAAVGAGMVTTDLTYSNATFPEARPTAVFDGATDYWSGAFKTGTSGIYTIDLQETRTLNAIGICLQHGVTQSAVVAVSTNGTTWTNVATPTNSKHFAMDYAPFTAIAARYVRVTVTGAGPRIGLNELELYSTTDTYENYAQYLAPLDYNTPPNGGFAVTEGVPPAVYGYQSARALYLADTDSDPVTGNKTITKTTTSATSKTLEFWVKPLSYAASSGAFQFHLISGSSPVYHLAVFSNGSVNYHTTGWNQIAGAGTVPLGVWSRIRVVATMSPATASVYVNGNLIGTAAKKGTATSMNGFLFGSGGSVSSGDTAFIDDVYFN